MKQLFSISIITLLSGCGLGSRDKIKSFIPGTYVSSYQQEYSKGQDTLVFTSISDEGNSYLITRLTSYKRIINGKEQPVGRKKEQMTGIYNEQDKVIYEGRKGKTFSFSPERNIVLSGTSEYRKID
jgi:hypothetical protein